VTRNRITAWKAVTPCAAYRGRRSFPNFTKLIVLSTVLQLCYIQSGKTAERTIALLTSQGSPYLSVSDSLSEDLSNLEEIRLHQLSTEGAFSEPNTIINRSELTIAIGTKALRFLAEHHPDATVLAIFTTSYSFNAAIAGLPSNRHQFFGLFIDQPLGRYLYLARLLLPEAKTLGVTEQPDKHVADKRPQVVAAECGFVFENTNILEHSNPIRLLDSVFAQSDAFLALPNTSSITRSSAKWILYLASRHQKPVIAFSEKYVTGGALAAVYAAPNDISKEAGRIVEDWLKSGVPAVPWRRMGQQFSVKTNTGIARYLGVTLDDNAKLLETLAKIDHKSTCPAQVSE
jgi:putative ABC transport system substrate-binding protein